MDVIAKYDYVKRLQEKRNSIDRMTGSDGTSLRLFYEGYCRGLTYAITIAQTMARKERR